MRSARSSGSFHSRLMISTTISMLLTLLPLLFLLLAFACSTMTTPTHAQSTLNLVYVYDGGSTVANMQAVTLAADDVNNSTLLMPSTFLNLTVVNLRGTDRAATIKQQVSGLTPYLLASNPNKADAVIPSLTPSVALATAYLGTASDTMLVSPGLPALEVADRTTFPFVARTLTTDDMLIGALINLLQRFGWLRVGIVTLRDDVSLAFADRVFLMLTTYNITIYRYGVPVDNLPNARGAVSYMVEQRVRVIFVHTFSPFLFTNVANSMLNSSGVNLLHNGYVLIGSTYPSAPLYGSVVMKTPTNLANTYKYRNIIGLRQSDPSGAVYNDVNSRFKTRFNNPTGMITADAAHYDTVWTIARAYAQALANNGGNPVNATHLAQAVRTLNFTGITGDFSFSSSMNRWMTYSTVQWMVNSTVTVNATTGVATTTYTSGYVVRGSWSAGTSQYTPDPNPAAVAFQWGVAYGDEVPVDRDPPTDFSYPVDPVTITSDLTLSTTPLVSGTTPFTFVSMTQLPSWISIDPTTGSILAQPEHGDIRGTFELTMTVTCSNPAGTATTSLYIKVLEVAEYEMPAFLTPIVATLVVITALWIVALMGLVIKFRNALVIKSSSPFFLVWNLVGALWLNCVATLFVAKPTADNHLCETRMWMTPLAVITMLAPLFIKTYRIKRIFIQRQMTVVRLSTRDLVAGVLAITMPAFCFLLAFQAGDWIGKFETTREASVGSQYIVSQCMTSDPLVFALLAYVFLLLAWAAHMAWHVRRVPAAFNEASHINTVLVFFVLYGALIVPVQYLVDNQPFAVGMLRAIGVLVSVWVCTVAIYVPKLNVMLQGRQNEKQGVYNHSVIDGGSSNPTGDGHNTNSGAMTLKLKKPDSSAAGGSGTSGASGVALAANSGSSGASGGGSGGGNQSSSGLGGHGKHGSTHVGASTTGDSSPVSYGSPNISSHVLIMPSSGSSSGLGTGGSGGGAVVRLAPGSPSINNSSVNMKMSSVSITASPSNGGPANASLRSSMSTMHMNSRNARASGTNAFMPAAASPINGGGGGAGVGNGGAGGPGGMSPGLSALRLSNNFAQVAQYRAASASGSDIAGAPVVGIVNMSGNGGGGGSSSDLIGGANASGGANADSSSSAANGAVPGLGKQRGSLSRGSMSLSAASRAALAMAVGGTGSSGGAAASSSTGGAGGSVSTSFNHTYTTMNGCVSSNGGSFVGGVGVAGVAGVAGPGYAVVGGMSSSDTSHSQSSSLLANAHRQGSMLPGALMSDTDGEGSDGGGTSDAESRESVASASSARRAYAEESLRGATAAGAVATMPISDVTEVAEIGGSAGLHARVGSLFADQTSVEAMEDRL